VFHERSRSPPHFTYRHRFSFKVDSRLHKAVGARLVPHALVLDGSFRFSRSDGISSFPHIAREDMHAVAVRTEHKDLFVR
jgi:hypothetical protein